MIPEVITDIQSVEFKTQPSLNYKMILDGDRIINKCDKLEAMTSVCSVGLDMIALSGDTPEDVISGIIADEMAIGMINKKTTAVRVIPVPDKKVGDIVRWGGLLGEAPIMPINTLSAQNFVSRGGRIPAPIHSLNN